jgi:hypothetical protein
MAMAPAKPASTLRRKGTLFVLMYLSAVVLSVVSGIETFMGLLEFSPAGPLGWVIAAGLTFGVQVLLFAISWKIAENLREGVRVLAPQAIAWAICAFFSGYFSFYGFFYGQGGASETLRQNAVRSEVVSVIKTVDDSLSTEIERSHQALIAPGGALRAWEAADLRPMIDLARDSKSQLAQASAAKRADLQAESDRLKTRESDLRRSKAQLEFGLGQLLTSISQREAEVLSLQQALQQARAQLASVQATIPALDAKQQQECVTGQGPRCRAARNDLNTARSEELEAQGRIDGATATLEAASQALGQLKAQEAANPDADRLRDIEGELVQLAAELVAVQEGFALLQKTVGADFSDADTQFAAAIARLLDRDYTAAESLRAQCAGIRDLLLQSALSDRVQGMRCDSPDVDTRIAELRNIENVLAAYRTSCVEPPVAFEAVEGDPNGRKLVNPAIETALECVAKSPNADQRFALDSQLRDLIETRGDRASPMTVASVALFTDGETNAVMAALFAAIVDLLVLLCALIGKTAGKSEQVRAIDEVLRLLHTDPRDGFEYLLALPTDPRKVILIDETLNLLLREGLARWSDETRTAMLVRGTAPGYLRQLRVHEGDDTLATPRHAEAPAAPPPRKIRPL